MTQLLNQSEHRIDHLPGFAQYRFSESSSDSLTLPASVAFANERQSVLQSACEALAFRIATNGMAGSNDYQTTRTTAVYFKDNGHCYVALDDDRYDNILLTRAQEAHHAHETTGHWLLDKHDPLIERTLERAATQGRALPVPSNEHVYLTTTNRRGHDAYANSALVGATIGDMAPAYEKFLAKNGHQDACAWFLNTNSLNHLDDGTVDVRRVGIGGRGCGINYFGAGILTYPGRARGVRNTFPGNHP